MSADNTGGVAVWVWVLAGLFVGLVAGWWFGEFEAYVLMGTLLGTFIGQTLDHQPH